MSQEMGGIRQYSVTLLKILSKDLENKYYIFHESEDPEIMAVLASNPQLIHVTTVPGKEKVWSKYLKKIKGKLIFLYSKVFITHPKKDLLDELCKKHQIDIIHCPYQYLPQSKTAKSICTMHDLQELHFPEYFTPEVRAERATSYLKYIKDADELIVSYQHIKDDIIRYFQVSPHKIKVCLLDMANLWFDKYSASEIEALDTLAISYNFILYPANTWEHKNHQKLLEALFHLKEQGIHDIKLVCSGFKTPYYERTIKPFIDRHNLQEQVMFPGVLDERILYSLYKKCSGVIIPTLYEAGSFPLMESILLDIPVICSNITSLPETIGDNSFLFNPNDVFEISDKLKQLWNDDSYRERARLNCRKQSSRLRNTNALDHILAVYKSCLVVN